MTSTAPDRAPTAGVRSVAHRWPTLLALAFAAFLLTDAGDGRELAFPLLVAVTSYLVVAVLDRPRASWPVLLAATAAVGVVAGLDAEPWLVAAFLALAAAGLAAGPLRRRGLPGWQAPAALGFLAVVLAVPDAGPYLVAAGLIGHAGWDAVHWRAGAVVARSFAEWCGVLDLTLGVGVLILAT